MIDVREALSSISTAAILVALSASCWICTPTYAQDNPCPQKLAYPEAPGSYKFSWQSWSWQDKNDLSRRVFCNCFKNDDDNTTDNALFFDWKAPAGMRCFASPGAPPQFTYRGQMTATEVMQPAALWYGAQPDQMPTQVAVPKTVTTGSLIRDAGGAKIIAVSYTDSSDTSDKKTLTTEVTIGVPDISKLPRNLDGEQAIIAYVEAHPQIIRQISMTFTSAIGKNEDGVYEIINNCTYSFSGERDLDAAEDQRPNAFMSFADPDLQQKMFRVARPMPISWWRSNTFNISSEAERTSAMDKAISKETTLDFTQGGGVVLGSVSLDYFAAS